MAAGVAMGRLRGGVPIIPASGMAVSRRPHDCVMAMLRAGRSKPWTVRHAAPPMLAGVAPGMMAAPSAKLTGAAWRVASALVGAVTLMATTRSGKRRRRKGPPATDAPKTEPITTSRGDYFDQTSRELEDDTSTTALVAGRRQTALAREVAEGLAVTEEDRRRRRIKNRIMRAQKPEDLASDAQIIDELIEQYGDPEFFGQPFIWFQLGHLVLGFTLILAAISPDFLADFALFGLEGPIRDTLRASLIVAYSMNFLLAVFMFFEEFIFGMGENKLNDALGWAAKAILIGGVASWQRNHRVTREKEKQKRIAAEKERRNRIKKLAA